MGLLYLNIAAASCAVGVNVMDGENFEVDNWFRRVVRVGITGSNAVAGALGHFELKYGDRRVALLSSQSITDLSVSQLHMLPINSRLVCRPGEAIQLIVKTVSAGNEFRVLLDIKDIRPGR
jgi:hypothetical protein